MKALYMYGASDTNSSLRPWNQPVATMLRLHSQLLEVELKLSTQIVLTSHPKQFSNTRTTIYSNRHTRPIKITSIDRPSNNLAWGIQNNSSITIILFKYMHMSWKNRGGDELPYFFIQLILLLLTTNHILIL